MITIEQTLHYLAQCSTAEWKRVGMEELNDVYDLDYSEAQVERDLSVAMLDATHTAVRYTRESNGILMYFFDIWYQGAEGSVLKEFNVRVREDIYA